MIGIFDSGYGGLTIMEKIVKALPEYDYLYLGDNARTPYGNHSKETVTNFTEDGIHFLFEAGCRLIIIACFTASALALHELQGRYLRNPDSPHNNRKILGVIKPVVERAAEVSDGRIGVVGTKSTVQSEAFVKELRELDDSLKVKQQACPLLVPFIEEHWHHKPEARMVLKKYVRHLKDCNIDTLILGCTHYPLMQKEFARVMGTGVSILHPGEATAEKLCYYLARHPEIESQLSRGGRRQFCTTDDAGRFLKFGQEFTDLPVREVKRVEL
jgi:glutamate racemase